MTLPEVVSRDEWRVAHKQMPAAEMEFISPYDALNGQRRWLPTGMMDQAYVVEVLKGWGMLRDPFEGRPQVTVEHCTFGSAWDTGYRNCTKWFRRNPGRCSGRRRHASLARPYGNT